MSKSPLNSDFWIEQESIGFTFDGLKRLGQIWNFIPRVQVGQKITFGQPIATIETTQQLRSIISPIAGTLIEINAQIISNPELISEETPLFKIRGNENALFGV
jgi:glycine cleavage system H lipoate-binding protein